MQNRTQLLRRRERRRVMIELLRRHGHVVVYPSGRAERVRQTETPFKAMADRTMLVFMPHRPPRLRVFDEVSELPVGFWSSPIPPSLLDAIKRAEAEKEMGA